MLGRNSLILPFLFIGAYAIREEDLIKSLPNVTFTINFKQYSGYLNADDEGNWKMFYWLADQTLSILIKLF
jgi:hypothetical protein